MREVCGNCIYDKSTSEWFRKNKEREITVCRCERCGLFYKPSLGHECKIHDDTCEDFEEKE